MNKWNNKFRYQVASCWLFTHLCSEGIIDVTHVICTAHRILSDLITLTILEQGYKLFNFLQSVGRSQCFAHRP